MGQANTNTTANNPNSGEHMNDQPKRTAFDDAVRHTPDGAGFNLASAADIGLKSLIAATCGVVIYKTFASNDSK
ncbi:MAG: hypothetical protein VXZ72_00080 [Chlamydiota bacterium]|nr:hypothetical protein [Chlamydiota bacterium]